MAYFHSTTLYRFFGALAWFLSLAPLDDSFERKTHVDAQVVAQNFENLPHHFGFKGDETTRSYGRWFLSTDDSRRLFDGSSRMLVSDN